MGQPIIFVSGIHGAGKSEISKALANLIGGSHVTAGALIREAAGVEGPPAAGPGLKTVIDVPANQAHLLIGLEAYRRRITQSHGERPIILDGHFCLLGSGDQVVDVPQEVMMVIGPIAALLVEADLETVHGRLLRRDGTAPPSAAIAALDRGEERRAALVCSELGIPLLTVAGHGEPAQAAGIHAAALRRLIEEAK